MGAYVGGVYDRQEHTSIEKKFDKPQSPANDQCKVCKHDPHTCADLPFWTMPNREFFDVEGLVECTAFEYDDNWMFREGAKR